MREAERSRRRIRLLRICQGRAHVRDMNRIWEQRNTDGKSTLVVACLRQRLRLGLSRMFHVHDDGVAIGSIVSEYRDARNPQIVFKKMNYAFVDLAFRQLR